MENDKAQRLDPTTGYVHSDPVTDSALDWLLKLDAHPADATIRAGFDAWCRQDPRHAAAFADLKRTWTLPELDLATRRLADSAPPVATARALSPTQRKRPVTRWMGAIAATLLLALALQQYSRLALDWEADYRTETGATREITLPDGSRVTLNTDSAVALDFENGRRAVTLLQGEAFFDVVPDTIRPFTVAGHYSEVTVMGTGFSVRTGENEDLVVLDHGKVEVARLPERTDTAVLDPGEAVKATATSLSSVRPVDTVASLAWLEGRIVFDGQTLSSVLDDLRRYYPAPVIVADDTVGQTLVSGNYRLSDPEGTIRSLATAAGATFTRLPGGIIILR
ncbi:FecR domain-containing protein [Ciceribacter sp. L1K23]|uniref:FecR family protein n=1 Tax=Ciceribacter sp. L1K23 TaxID=2820276 RepID=UPI001B810B1E|nr:FecR domain-containing protein [Ciceribacter sp. L1K23]